MSLRDVDGPRRRPEQDFTNFLRGIRPLNLAAFLAENPSDFYIQLLLKLLPAPNGINQVFQKRSQHPINPFRELSE